jgi:DNA-binding beta-propeller fold protein YncE
MTEKHNEELNRYWNALVAGDHTADECALDTNDIETVRGLHRAAAATRSSPRAEEAWPKVLTRILETETAPGERPAWKHIEHAAPPLFAANGLAPSAAPRPRPRPMPRHVWPGLLATAALLALTLTAGLFTFGPLRPASRETIVPLPAAESAGIAVGQFESLWQAPSRAERLDDPSDLAVGPDGRIWVIDASRGTIELLAPDGTFLESWGAPGAGDGQFNFSSGIHPNESGDIAFAPDGSFYIADSGNFRVQKFAADRSFLLSWGEEGEADGQFLRPSGIAIDAAGTVYVSDELRADIQVFDGEGRFLNAFGGIGVKEGQLILPQGIAVDPRGMLWVVDRGNNRVQQFDAAGTVHAIVGSVGLEEGEFNQPHDIAVDSLGRLYVAEEGMSRVQVLDRDGRVLASVDGYSDNSLLSPVGVAVGADGAVFVSDTAGLKAFRVLLPFSALLMP